MLWGVGVVVAYPVLGGCDWQGAWGELWDSHYILFLWFCLYECSFCKSSSICRPRICVRLECVMCQELWKVWDLSNLQTCHSFMVAGRRLNTPGSETKKLIAHSKTSSMSVMFAPALLAPPPQSCPGEAQMDAAHAIGLCQLRNPKLREPKSFIMGYKQAGPTFAIKEDSILL